MKNQSAAMAGKIPKASEIDINNMKMLTFEQLLAEHKKALDEINKKIRDEQVQEIRRKEEEAVKHYVSHFSVDRQGKVTKIKDVNFDSSQTEVKTDENKQPVIDTKIANMVDGAVVAHLNNKLEFVGQNLHSMFDARFSRIEAYLGMSSIGDDKHTSTSNTDKTMGNPASGGIPAVTNAMVMSSANQSFGRINETMPQHKTIYSSTPNASVPPHGRQVRSDMFLHSRTLLNTIVHRLRVGLGPMMLDRVVLKGR
jgi:hypothetical protein